MADDYYYATRGDLTLRVFSPDPDVTMGDITCAETGATCSDVWALNEGYLYDEYDRKVRYLRDTEIDWIERELEKADNILLGD